MLLAQCCLTTGELQVSPQAGRQRRPCSAPLLSQSSPLPERDQGTSGFSTDPVY